MWDLAFLLLGKEIILPLIVGRTEKRPLTVTQEALGMMRTGHFTVTQSGDFRDDGNRPVFI